MRTTLDLDPDVLAAARSLAASQRISLGRAVSDLAMRGLRARSAHVVVNAGFPIVAGAPGHVLTDELVQRLRDDE